IRRPRPREALDPAWCRLERKAPLGGRPNPPLPGQTRAGLRAAADKYPPPTCRANGASEPAPKWSGDYQNRRERLLSDKGSCWFAREEPEARTRSCRLRQVRSRLLPRRARRKPIPRANVARVREWPPSPHEFVGRDVPIAMPPMERASNR